MTTFAALLDQVQFYLQDVGELWTREELLSYANDGLRQLLSQSHAVHRLTALDVPGHMTWSVSHQWEREYTAGGTAWQWSITADTGGYACSALWEVEWLEGIATTAASERITQPWERAHSNPTHQYYRFALPRDSQRIVKLWYDNQLLLPVTVRELDAQWQHWMSLGGEPIVWTEGTGQNRQVDVYEIVTADHAAYQMAGALEGLGMVRAISGGRTYTHEGEALTELWSYTRDGEGAIPPWEGVGVRITLTPVDGVFALFAWEQELLQGESGETVSTYYAGTSYWEQDYGAAPYALYGGTIRRISSPGRQYLANAAYQERSPVGVARWWGSSDLNLLLLATIGPEIPELFEDDEVAALVPDQMSKYLRYYVLARAWNRQGEGYMPGLASLCMQRFTHGVAFFRSMGWLSRKDLQLARQPVGRQVARPPRPRLPSTYPAVRW